MKYEKFVVFKPEDLYWEFKNNTLPYLQFDKPLYDWAETIHVDPFPCASHDLNLVKNHVEKIEKIFPIGNILQWVISPFEIDGRTNAWASSTDLWVRNNDTEEIIQEKNKHKLSSYVILSGKRTIVHPAMTKYLVAHEYGHQVDYWISKLLREEATSKDEDIDSEAFRKLYAEFRKVNLKTGYGGGRWVNNIAEIIADDFRITMCGVDIDFFVHDKVPHPLTDNTVTEFWNELKEKYSFKNN